MSAFVPGLTRRRKIRLLVEELRAELAADPPRKPALPAAFAEQQGEFGRRVEILGNHAHAAFRGGTDVAPRRRGNCGAFSESLEGPR